MKKTSFFSIVSLLLLLASMSCLAINDCSLIKKNGGNTYYVSKKGNDKNPGTKELPFKTLVKAAGIVKAGDSCFVYGGIYREILKTKNNGTAKNPIVFQAVAGEKVSISALDELTYTTNNKNLAVFNVDFEFNTDNFILCDENLMILARWPNKTNDKLLDSEAAPIFNKGSSPTGIVNPNFPSNLTSENLKGATVWASAQSQWSCWTSHVTGYDAASKKILLKGFGKDWWIDERHNPATPHKHYGDGKFYVAGAKVLLDTPGEWYFQKKEKKLYLLFPKGKTANDATISVNRRKYTIDLRNRSYIKINNISTVGAIVSFENASNCSVNNGQLKHFYYSFGKNSKMGITKTSGILLSGKNNSIQNCEIFGSAGSGVIVSGTNNKIINCDIHDVNFLGSHAGAPISLKGKSHLISHNSIHDTGRVCISMGGGSHTIQYNDIYNPGRNSEDLGVIKCGGTDADNIHIHHNKIHNNNDKFIGIYFDNYSNNIIAHHNIVSGMKDGIRSNRPGQYHIIYNNTVSPDINNKYGPWEGPFDQFGSVVVNNKTSLAIMAKPEVFQQNNIRFDSKTEKTNSKRTPLSDFPNYSGALDEDSEPFKTGHDFNNPPQDTKKEYLPFVRNHVKNGSFDYGTTYAKAEGNNNDKFSHWTVEGKGKVSIEHFPGFNFPTNPEDRYSIHGHSLVLAGNKKASVVQYIYSLEPNRTYTLGAYIKAKEKGEVLIEIKQKGKLIKKINTQEIEFTKKSNWKFVKLDFELGRKNAEISLHLTKTGEGQVYIDNIGLLPIPKI
tara:strand:+ start:5350 stop:7695 length:2346 start_codon:yes stop_codon:yes gene_type:complete